MSVVVSDDWKLNTTTVVRLKRPNKAFVQSPLFYHTTAEHPQFHGLSTTDAHGYPEESR